MIGDFDGFCALINKSGVCYQCRGLRDNSQGAHRGPDLVQIEVAPGVAVSPENLVRCAAPIVRDADLGTATRG